MANVSYSHSASSYPERLQTFEGYWNDNEAAARQLAALGHVYDRPPLERFDEGTRCVACNAFVKRHLSVRALEGSGNDTASYQRDFESFDFHHPGCTRLQIRTPLDPQAVIPGLHGGHMSSLRRKFETDTRRSLPPQAVTQHVSQRNSWSTLPTEIRLQIYALLLPSLDHDTQIVQMNRDSARVITKFGYERTGPRNTTNLNILRTCRAVHEEAVGTIYSKITFRFESTKVMYLFLRSIGATGRGLIESVDVYCGSREDAMAFALLAVCDGLRSICIGLSRPSLFYPRAPIWIIDGVTCLLALSGLEQVHFRPKALPLRALRSDDPDAIFLREQLTRTRGVPMDCTTIENGFVR